MNCRRCKQEFTPEHQEARCSNCLQNRKNNRVAKRRQARDVEKELDTIRRLMASNGRKNNSSIRGMLR